MEASKTLQLLTTILLHLNIFNLLGEKIDLSLISAVQPFTKREHRSHQEMDAHRTSLSRSARNGIERRGVIIAMILSEKGPLRSRQP